MHTARAHLEPRGPWNMHQPHGFLVRECFSEYHRRLFNTCPAHARCQKVAATSTTTIGSDDGFRLGRLVSLFSDSHLMLLKASQRLHHINFADDHAQYWIQS